MVFFFPKPTTKQCSARFFFLCTFPHSEEISKANAPSSIFFRKMKAVRYGKQTVRWHQETGREPWGGRAQRDNLVACCLSTIVHPHHHCHWFRFTFHLCGGHEFSGRAHAPVQRKQCHCATKEPIAKDVDRWRNKTGSNVPWVKERSTSLAKPFSLHFLTD